MAVLAVILTLAVSLLVLAFSWTTVTSSAKDIPVAIVGPAAQIESAIDVLSAQEEEIFTLIVVESRAESVKRIEMRDVQGAILLGPESEVLTASAGSPIVSQLLENAAAQLGRVAAAQTSAPNPVDTTTGLPVTDVVPLSSTDPRGAGLSTAPFPLVLMGLLGGILFSLLVVGTRQRLTALLLFSLVGAAAVSGILQGLLGILQGAYLPNFMAVALATLASSATIIGLHSILGKKGIPIGAITLMLIANPISAATQPVQFLVGPWGAIGQWFVPGATATLLRDLSYFPQAQATAFSWSVLATWAIGGIALIIKGTNFRKTNQVFDNNDPSESNHSNTPVN